MALTTESPAEPTTKALKALLTSRRLPVPTLAPASGVVAGWQLATGAPAEPVTASGTAHFIDRGGLVLTEVHVWLIFWGTAWIGASPTMPEVTDAVQKILDGPYMSGLSQYRGIQRGTFKGAISVTDSDPPDQFFKTDVTNLIHQQIGRSALPEPDEDPSSLYCVIMPPGVASAEPSVVGEHSYFIYFDLSDFSLPSDIDIARAHYAWVTNDGTLDTITTIFSHELVESATDPNGDGVQGVPGTCNQDGWCEIGDVCWRSEVRDGVRVQAYWSEADQACIVPGAPTAAAPSTPDGSATTGDAPATAPDAPVTTADASATTPDGSATTSEVTTTMPLGSATIPVGSTTNEVAVSRPRPERGARFAAGLLQTAWLGPIIAAVVIVAAYVALTPLPPSTAVLVVPAGGAIGLVAWLLLAAAYAPMTRALSASSTSYADLLERLTRLEARLASVPLPSRTSAYTEALRHRDFIAAELQTSGIRWVTAVGYIALWNRLHRAEEALIEVEPRTQVLADALYDEWRMQDSTVDHATELMANLELARQYLVTAQVADSPAPAIRSETEARAVVAKVRYAIDDFRDKRRAGLVRARNTLMTTMFITEFFALALLSLAVVTHAPASAIVAAIVFYLVGALVGLFNRLGQEVGAETMVEDFSLAGVRLLLTPTLSGLAAVGGVVLTGMLAMSGLVTLTQPSGGSAPPLNLPALADIFDLNKFRIGLPLAALFGSAPALLSRRLQQLTDQYKDDLKSTDPSSAAPAPKH